MTPALARFTSANAGMNPLPSRPTAVVEIAADAQRDLSRAPMRWMTKRLQSAIGWPTNFRRYRPVASRGTRA